MKKTYYLTAALCIAACAGLYAQSITTDASLYTNEELVNNILISSSCLGVSNITVADGSVVGTPSISAFSALGTTFPFEGGIILSTGNVLSAPGPISTSTSGGTWAGDADLLALNTANGNTNPIHDATVIEFDFVPLISNISFDFIFASNEYGTFQCFYADVFAFLLTDVATGITTNLAVIPGSTIPISVTTIRDSQYNTACASANVDYFGEYYGNNPATAPINFLGRTVPLSAQSDVIPGHTYHIKMAIGDYSDSAFDSAVFIGSASFNIGNFDEYLAIESSAGNFLCYGSETVLSIPPVESFSYQWNLNGNPIDGATTSTLTVADAGNYTLNVTSPLAQCMGIASYTLAFGITEEVALNFAVPALTATADAATGIATFDLSQTQAYVLANFPAGYTVSFYATADDAYYGTNALPLYYTSADSVQTIYARLENTASGCFTTTAFDLITDSTAGLGQTAFNGFNYVPNPVTDKLLLSNNATFDKIEIFNLLGQKQLDQAVSATTVQINLGSLPQGVYILKAYSGDSQKAVRIIKQ